MSTEAEPRPEPPIDWPFLAKRYGGLTLQVIGGLIVVGAGFAEIGYNLTGAVMFDAEHKGTALGFGILLILFGSGLTRRPPSSPDAYP